MTHVNSSEDDFTEEVHVAPKKVKISRQLINDIYDEISLIISERKEFSPSVMIDTIPLLMNMAEAGKKLLGEQKKSLVIHVLTRYVNEQLKESEYYNELVSLIDRVVPTLIDTFVSIDIKKVRIKIRKKFTSCTG